MQRTLNIWLLGAAVLMLGGVLIGVMTHEALAQAKGPADLVFDGGGQGRVTFSHSAHAAKHPKCTDCHTKLFKMTKGQRSSPTMAKMEKGQSCGACHNGQAAFSVKAQADCAKCHKK